MPLSLGAGYPSLLLRREAFERSGLTRAGVDARLGLTADEFRVEGDLVCVGPIHDDVALEGLLSDLETAGLVYFDDFFDLSGTWPSWLVLYAMAGRGDHASTGPA